MALIKFGSGISAMSGAVGGVVYAKNRYGNYARNWAKPVNPNTSRQAAVRNTMAQLVQAWKDTLTETQRYQWNVYASNVQVKNRLGEDIYLSGFNQFCRSNLSILNAGLTQVDGGPGILSLPNTDISLATAYAAGAQQVSVTFDDTLDWLDEAGGAMLIYVGQPVSESKSFFAGPYRYAGSIEGDDTTPPTTPAVISTPFVVQAGQKLWTRARIVRADGRLSNFFQPSTAVCA